MNFKALRRSLSPLASILLLVGCAGQQRACSNYSAETFGADWLIVQYDMTIHPAMCWRLKGTSVVNEEKSDGIHWMDPHGHLMHIQGWYNRVQISNGDWDSAAHQLGIKLAACSEGHYPTGSEG